VTLVADGLVLVTVSTAEGWRAPEVLGLSDAEREVAVLAAQGFSNADMARRRGRSIRTVANQLAAIYVKLDVKGRRELRACLGQHGIQLEYRRG
jgi:DNA-binding CsgD family transcriptional regulator